jgi:MFS family permease
MLWIICLFGYADRFAFPAVYPALQKSFGFSNTQIGLMAATFQWTYALMAPFAGRIGDRVARKTVIIGGLCLWSAFTGFTALCAGYWQFVAVLGVTALGEAFYFPAAMSIISDYHLPATRSRAMSLHQSGVYAGTVAGSVIAGFMALHYGWRSPFVLLGIAGVALAVVLRNAIREPARNEAEIEARISTANEADPQEGLPERKERSSSTPFLAILRTPSVLLIMLAFFGANSVAWVFFTWMPKFLKVNYHMDLARAGFSATFYFQFASIFGVMLGGVLADRWSRRRAGGRLDSQVLGLVMGAPFIFLCGFTHDRLWLVGAMTAFGLCKGIYDANLWASLFDFIPPEHRGGAVGFMNMVGYLGSGLATLLIGVVIDHGVSMRAAISATGSVYIVVACVIFCTARVFAPRDVRVAPTPAPPPRTGEGGLANSG